MPPKSTQQEQQVKGLNQRAKAPQKAVEKPQHDAAKTRSCEIDKKSTQLELQAKECIHNLFNVDNNQFVKDEKAPKHE